MRQYKELIVSKEVRKSLTGLLLKGEPSPFFTLTEEDVGDTGVLPTPFFTLKKANVKDTGILLNRFPDMKWCSLIYNAAGYDKFDMEYLEIRGRWVAFNYTENIYTEYPCTDLIMLKGAFNIINENGSRVRRVFRSTKLSGSFFLVDRKTQDLYFFSIECGSIDCRDRLFDFIDKLILEDTPQDKTLTLVGLNLGDKAQSVLMERIKKGRKSC